MVVAKQKNSVLFLDKGCGDIVLSYNYNYIDLSLSYKTDSRNTPLRDLLLTEDEKPLKLKYTYSGIAVTVLNSNFLVNNSISIYLIQ